VEPVYLFFLFPDGTSNGPHTCPTKPVWVLLRMHPSSMQTFDLPPTPPHKLCLLSHRHWYKRYTRIKILTASINWLMLLIEIKMLIAGLRQIQQKCCLMFLQIHRRSGCSTNFNTNNQKANMMKKSLNAIPQQLIIQISSAPGNQSHEPTTG
jgi:hypothetical protein